MLAGGVAYASIPDAGGVIHGCYAKRDGSLRVIDTGGGGTCSSSKETALDWSQTGPQGPPGSGSSLFGGELSPGQHLVLVHTVAGVALKAGCDEDVPGIGFSMSGFDLRATGMLFLDSVTTPSYVNDVNGAFDRHWNADNNIAFSGTVATTQTTPSLVPTDAAYLDFHMKWDNGGCAYWGMSAANS